MSSLQSYTVEEKKQQHEYQTGFDTKCYIERYTDIDLQYNKFSVTSLHHIFTNGLAKGNSLLEIGCGPTIHSVISASRYFNNIVTSDFLESNRAAVLKWLKNDPGAHDWSPVFKHIAALEKEEDYRKLEKRVRKSIKDVIPCDVLLSNPISPVQKHFDVIVTSYCLENAATDLTSYKKVVANLSNLMNPGGVLIIMGAVFSFYFVGNKRFVAPIITKDELQQALKAANLNLVHWHAEFVKEKSDYDDCSEIFVAVACN